MRILIVYENVPDSTDLFVVDVTEAEWAWMRKTHLQYLNGTMPKSAEKACNQLSEWLTSKKPLKSKKPVLARDLEIDFVLLTGFVM